MSNNNCSLPVVGAFELVGRLTDMDMVVAIDGTDKYVNFADLGEPTRVLIVRYALKFCEQADRRTGFDSMKMRIKEAIDEVNDTPRARRLSDEARAEAARAFGEALTRVIALVKPHCRMSPEAGEIDKQPMSRRAQPRRRAPIGRSA